MSHSVLHTTFVIERTYPAKPERVFRAFQDPRIKQKWFVEGEGWEVDEFSMDFRVGGREFGRFRFGDSPEIRNETVYQDIVPDNRIVIVYTMTLGDQRISSSLATMEFKNAGTGTTLVYTEQAAFFDGADNPAGREEGCRELFDKLGTLMAQPE